MPRKGMRSIFSARSSDFDNFSSPSFSTARTSFVESIMYQTLEQAEPIITNSTSLFHEKSSKVAKKFIKQVIELHKAMQSLVSEDSSSKLLVSSHNLMQVAMKRLQKDFHQILSMNQAYLNLQSVSARTSLTSTRSSLTSTRSSLTSTRSSSSDSGDDTEDETRVADHQVIVELENASAVVISDLKLIADCMISCGYGKECVGVYVSVRKSIVDEGIQKLGLDKKSLSKKIRNSDFLDLKIKNWLNAVNIAMSTLFYGEKILCDQVFAASNSIRETCFNEITKEAATILFKFPENMMKSRKKSPEKIFSTLDIYTAIASHWQEIESIFSSESMRNIIDQVSNLTRKLADSVRSALFEFEIAIHKKSSKNHVAKAGVDQLTTDVMNYLSLLADYNVLGDILADSTSSLGLTDSEDSSLPIVSRRLGWLILVLLSKVDRKAEHYKDTSFSYLFLANNLNYVVSKVRASNLKYLLGEDWISENDTKIKLFAAKYERVGWSHVIQAVPSKPTSMTMWENVQESIQRFNVLFEEVHTKQNANVIPDNKLRDEIKMSIAKKLLPAYREFYGAFENELFRGRSFVNVFRFAPEDLGHALSDLFFGSGRYIGSY